MSAGSVSQNIASQIEYVRPELEELIQFQAVFWKRVNKATDIKAISNRQARIPFTVQNGASIRTGANLFDGNDMGRGGAPTQAFGNLSAISFVQASEYTSLSEFSTDSDSKAIENYVTQTNQMATETMAAQLDSLGCNSDGSNTLDSVVSVNGTGLVVNNANAFISGQILDCWTALGGTNLGTVEVLSVDIANDTIWLTGNPPIGVTGGTLLLVTGSAGQANSGVFGIPYYHVSGNTGNFMGILRSTWPGIFSTPSITLGSGTTTTGSLTPASVRGLQGQVDQAMGVDASDDDTVAHMDVDSSAAWENNALAVQSIDMASLRGDASLDMLKKKQGSVIAGHEILKNTRAKPGRIDFLNFKHWFRLETKALDMHDVGGQTLFPVYGGSGGLNSSQIFYLELMFQFGLGQPRRDAYIPNINIPRFYFGH